MKLMEKRGLKFYVRDYPRFDDEFCVGEVVESDVYKIRNWDFKNGIIVDIGANMGTFSIPASKLGRVYAYEPNINNFQVLKMNIAVNHSNVEAFNCAVGKQGEDTIENSSGHSRIGSAGGKGIQQVNVIGLNEILNNFDLVDVLKCDCEGGEYNVFKYVSLKNLKKIKRICGEFHSWIFEDTNFTKEHKEMIAKLEKVFDLKYEGYKSSAFFGVNKCLKK